MLYSNGHKEAREWIEIGKKFAEFKKHPEAIEYYNKAIDLNRDYGYGAAARFLKAKSLIELQDMDNALVQLWMAVDLFPYIFYDNENTLKEYDYSKEAKSLFEKLKQENPNFKQIWFVIYNNASLKDEPLFDNETKDISLLREGDMLTFMEKSDLSYNQNYYKVPQYQGYSWYKVKTKDGKEGWIFGQHCQSYEIMTTNLYRAIKHGKLEYVQGIFNKGAEANVLIEDGNSPLHHAAMAGYPDIVEFLIQKGGKADIHGINTYTPLHFAKNVEVAELLLKAGADINAKGWSDMSPLHIAVEYGNLDLVKFYITHGADINAQGIMGATPLELARDENIKKFLQETLEKKAEKTEK
ncbi:MAG: ankyrin repeat domain-containing protein [Leptospiraceae bacterium]|nr:ankyrin repeat domain-containing protein [Leptospiraceae bacterium]